MGPDQIDQLAKKIIDALKADMTSMINSNVTWVCLLSAIIFAGGLVILLGKFPCFRQEQNAKHDESCRLVEALRPYSLQIVGLTFILPVILASAALLNLKSEAITALLGAMIGYIFGSGGSSRDDSRLGGNPSTRNNPNNPGSGGAAGSGGATGATGT